MRPSAESCVVLARRLGRKWTGVELSEQYAAKALERVKVEGAQPWQAVQPPPVIRKWKKRLGPRRKGRPRKAKPAEKNLFAPPEEDVGPAATGT